MRPVVFNIIDLKDHLQSFHSADHIISFIHKQFKEASAECWVALNDQVKGIILNKSAYGDNVFEVHREYYDLHVTIHGEDKMYWAENTKKLSEYEPDEDYQLLHGENVGTSVILSNQAVLIPPGIPHINELKEKSLKMVFKINKSLCQK